MLSATYDTLLEEVERALDGVPDERIVSVSYSTSRILGVWPRHHALIVIREADTTHDGGSSVSPDH